MKINNIMIFSLAMLAIAYASFVPPRMFEKLIENDESIRNKVALVTGGSTGIGYATALLIA
jgi:hypothetical protein